MLPIGALDGDEGWLVDNYESWPSIGQWVPHDQGIIDDPAADEMLLDDPLEQGRVTRGVPGAFRIDDGDGTALTDAQAVGFGAKDAALLRQPELFETALQKLPRREATIFVAALRLRLIAAQKDMPPRERNADTLGNRAL
jgi:hypothetical protein